MNEFSCKRASKSNSSRPQTQKKEGYPFCVFVTVFCLLFAVISFSPFGTLIVVSLTPYKDFVSNPVAILPPWPLDFSYYRPFFPPPCSVPPCAFRLQDHWRHAPFADGHRHDGLWRFQGTGAGYEGGKSAWSLSPCILRAAIPTYLLYSRHRNSEN